MGLYKPIGVFSFIYIIILAVPTLAAVVRRLHDTGYSAWMLLAVLVPVIGWIWLLALLASARHPDGNRYGDPSQEAWTGFSNSDIHSSPISTSIEYIRNRRNDSLYKPDNSPEAALSKKEQPSLRDEIRAIQKEQEEVRQKLAAIQVNKSQTSDKLSTLQNQKKLLESAFKKEVLTLPEYEEKLAANEARENELHQEMEEINQEDKNHTFYSENLFLLKERLEKLEDLFNQGLLTESQFEEKKEALLRKRV